MHHEDSAFHQPYIHRYYESDMHSHQQLGRINHNYVCCQETLASVSLLTMSAYHQIMHGWLLLAGSANQEAG